ncbi:MAG TPA: 2-C-methyl-D-erythritol 4-phosphate cytidylyltransferase [Thermoanaerobaculia bacterium]|nr:2-C-methyl-D-erythritol 4-phosphate cytidylyltransferase [Thermoanaerobaculia bacterium]
MSLVVIVPAAGSGIRFGAGVPKQFQPLGGKPLLQHVVERFLLDDNILRVIVAVAEPLLANVKQTPGDRTSFVAGGATRQQSVANALAAAPEETTLVAIHDAVRPFFSNDVFASVVAAATEQGAALPVLPLNDTIHLVRNEMVVQSVDRSTLAAAQTPQCFRIEVLREVLERAEREGLESTDEAGLAAHFGFPVKAVGGDSMNFKITRPEDLMLAELLLKEWTK